MAEKTIFQKIIDREAPADIVYETDDVLAFKDINPSAPEHILVIPKKPIERLHASEAEDEALLGKLLLAAKAVAEKRGLRDSGYRVIINNGPHAGELVPHLHLHVIGGTDLGQMITLPG